MGDRANIALVESDITKAIYLYTHWDGSKFPELLRKALIAGKSRWNDAPYLFRIIASTVFADIHGQETGGGISTGICDNDGHFIIIVSAPNKNVYFAREEDVLNQSKWFGEMSFEQYVSQGHAKYPGEPAL